MLKKIKVVQDSDPESPRDWDNLGTMTCWHRRRSLGDTHGLSELVEAIQEAPQWCESWYYEYNMADPRELLELAEKCQFIVLPLYLYDHSGITMNTHGFGCRFDSGQVGFIWVTRKDVRKEYGVKRISKALLERVYQSLNGEVETYDQYLRNDIYGFEAIDENDEVIHSCWGFYGDDPKTNGMDDHLPANWESVPVEVVY